MDRNYTVMPTKVYYLKMHEKLVRNTDGILNLKFSKLARPIDTVDYLYYYRTVGEEYNWLDRITMNESDLHEVINSSKTEVFVYYISHEPAGFAEFVREDEYTEILYFGLFPDYIGKGYGKHFLQTVINEAWSNNPKWIQLNTCELDHPNALSTYRKAGFELDKIIVEDRKVIQEAEG